MKNFIVMSLLASLSLTAFAGDEKEEEKVAKATPAFSSIDQNADGFISIEESQSVPHLGAVFEKLDTNKDQKLNKEEYSVFLKASK